MNIIKESSYWHVDGVVEAGVISLQIVGNSMIPSFLVSLTEETSIRLPHRIHIEHVEDVKSGAVCPCKGMQQDCNNTLIGCSISSY